jgi:hypothetical protein
MVDFVNSDLGGLVQAVSLLMCVGLLGFIVWLQWVGR